jgi:hypothetical protein
LCARPRCTPDDLRAAQTWPLKHRYSNVLNRRGLKNKMQAASGLQLWCCVEQLSLVLHVQQGLFDLVIFTAQNKPSYSSNVIIFSVGIRIRKFLDLPDPSIISKNSKKNLDFYCFMTSVRLFIFEELCKCTSVPDPNPDQIRMFLGLPDTLVGGSDPRIRIRTKMSRIRNSNTGYL